jgi:hypothetical protein
VGVEKSMGRKKGMYLICLIIVFSMKFFSFGNSFVEIEFPYYTSHPFEV